MLSAKYPLIIQQDVGGFQVMVDDCVLRTCVEIMQPACDADANLQALLPQEMCVIGVLEMLAGGATRHEIIVKDHFIVLIAVPDEEHKMKVAEL